MIVRCKNCHNAYETTAFGSEGDFCSFACKQEYEDKKWNNFVEKSAMIGAALSLQRQKEEEERRQKQAEAARQAAIQAQKEAQFAADAKAAGFEKAYEAKIWMNGGEYSLEEAALRKKSYDEKEAAKKAELEATKKSITDTMSYEQKQKQKQIDKINDLLKTKSPMYWFFIGFAVIGFVIGKFTPLPFWSSLFGSLVPACFLPYPLKLKSIKADIDRIKSIMGTDPFPFYNICLYDAAKKVTMYFVLMIFGIALTFLSIVFLFHVTWLKVVGVVLSLGALFLFLNSDGGTISFINRKDGFKFVFWDTIALYDLINYTRKTVGQFNLLINNNPDMNPLYTYCTLQKDKEERVFGFGLSWESFWECFLPYEDEDDFIKNYGKLTKTGIYSISVLRQKRLEIQKKYK